MRSETVERNKASIRRIFEEGFNQGDLTVVDEVVSATGVDRQRPDGPGFPEHLKAVITAMRTAFPDLHVAVAQLIGEGEWVALNSVVTGVNTGDLRPPLLPPNGPPLLPPTGRPINVAQMHFFRMQDGKANDLFHVINTLAMLGQLGLPPAARPDVSA